MGCELDLEQVHAFSDEEAGVIVSFATKYSSITTSSMTIVPDGGTVI